MIPSRNTSPFNEEDYICDCCGTHKRSWVNTFGQIIDSAKVILVSGVIYAACSEQCGRSLFDIHHRYALERMKDGSSS